MSKILVTGGCGFIGSHTAVDLIEHGYEVISIDNFYNSKRKVLDGIEQITGKCMINYDIDIRRFDDVRSVFEANPDILGIIHFAALKSVGESVAKPVKYFDYNLVGMINLLKCVVEFEVPHFIFSSSCTVYGQPDKIPVDENTPRKPAESPYGLTKQICEDLLSQTHSQISGLRSVILRYFNPAGAHPSTEIGEDSRLPASNLVPVITETASGLRPSMHVFGSDYPTRDGSCIRDYIHISDLATAHRLSLEYLMEGRMDSNPEIFNLGIGQGVTVLEAINAFEKISSHPLSYTLGPRREGDVVQIYSSFEKAKKLLGWTPKYGIEDIMETAWKWERRRNL